MRSRLLLLTATATCNLAACGTGKGPAPAGLEVVVDTIGDTTVVRTVSGSVWGAEATLVPEISVGEVDGAEEYLFGSISSIAVDDDRSVYVLDGQAQHVRVFDSAGTYVETLGRRGEGPGEFGYAEAIALLPDGRLVVRDSRNQRITVFGPGPGQTDHWGFDSGIVPGRNYYPLHTDVHGRTCEPGLRRRLRVGRDLGRVGWGAAGGSLAHPGGRGVTDRRRRAGSNRCG